MTANRRLGAFRSPTGGYVIVASAGPDGDWTHLVETLVERGYRPDEDTPWTCGDPLLDGDGS